MTRLDVVKYLIQEIEDEKKLFTDHDADDKQAYEKAQNEGGYYGSYKKLNGRQPSKNRIRDNCKKVRQLMLDISREE